ncbi:carboxypeptidase M32 [Paenibacillus baekrokdamisoli]|uniref:Metal-dependent carboxypeptidase n=1 Tax=Paenibacillus baekrokdamisoli TaxID=1712516 RepID=A0A3G9J911_9BACL|nr:carboxypeptidase M32 [Paenibacillus baekrokdamisoli]MBB3067046.1 carboxypeptidase Taq [Paenibacillus baekrokdamisoli]BBH19764.1 carboxypeptidase M32 [Paenibacillus baekrokdamisoli]
MTQNDSNILSLFLEQIKQMKSYEEALGVLYWDLRTGAPRKGMEVRSEVIGNLSAQLFKLSTAPELGEWLTELEKPAVYAELSEINQRLVTETRKEYDRSIKIPPKLHQEYVVLTSQAESLWEEAKEKNDYASFELYLDKIITYSNQFIDLWGVKEGSRYDTLLDAYEPGMTTAELDKVFGGLREKLVPLSAAIAASPHQPKTDFLKQTYAKEAQKSFSLFILKQMGFDFAAGRLDESAHPFATGLNPGDVRITTRYLIDDVVSALFGTIHEGGHALYEQNISKDLIGTTLATGTSMGIHESQSRFWENVIGRSKPFWNRYYKDLQQHFPNQLEIPVEDFYRATNVVQPSLIRIEADELTYNLHIIIRYEIEKLIFNEGVKASELPALWNEKYKEYLGVEPENDSEGVLQDVHWSGGAFGYFPSYSLGNMYAAQITNTLETELPNFWELVEEGNLLPIKEWLTEKVYQYGKLRTPSELIIAITGKPLDPDHLVAYLEKKYKDIYKL